MPGVSTLTSPDRNAADASGMTSPPQLQAVVTDLDGVLCDTETVLVFAINQFLAEENLAPLEFHEARTMIGLDNDSWWRRIVEMRALRVSLSDYTRRVDALARLAFPGRLDPAEGALELIADIRSRGIPLALATSSRREWAGQRLDILGITDAFDAIITGDLVTAHKPDPEIYLTATRKLGVDPANTLGIEDSPSGIRASRDAGLYTIAIRTPWLQEVDQSYAHRAVDSLRDIDLDELGLGKTKGDAR